MKEPADRSTIRYERTVRQADEQTVRQADQQTSPSADRHR
jgi:hypothetical protein